MGGWGDALAQAYNAASSAAKGAADLAMSSAQQAGKMVVSAANTVADGAVATGKAVVNVATFGAWAVTETVSATGKVAGKVVDGVLEAKPGVGGLYKAAKKKLSPTQPPRKLATEPCVNSLAGKRQRLEKRNSLIKMGQQPGSTPAEKAAAKRLAKNNEAVELARLSEDAYAQGISFLKSLFSADCLGSRGPIHQIAALER
jgi:hypothetical protein